MERKYADPLYHAIELPPLLVAFVDKLEFKRLARIMQLGTTHYVYPGATHTRFSHSIGTSERAHRWLRSLISNQPGLNISPKEILKVRLAGLCHDLGHGPFSHLFEEAIPEFSHENMSITLFTHMFDKYSDITELWESENMTHSDFTDVCDMILGSFDGKVKPFLFQIVCNKICGIDCDKMDYMARDSLYSIGSTAEYDADWMEHFIYVNPSGNLSFDPKTAENIHELFRYRAKMHQKVYQHHTVLAIDLMLKDALELSSDVLRLRECIVDPLQFLRLTDGYIEDNLLYNNDVPDEAAILMYRIVNRDLYKLTDETCDIMIPISINWTNGEASPLELVPFYIPGKTEDECKELTRHRLCECIHIPLTYSTTMWKGVTMT